MTVPHQPEAGTQVIQKCGFPKTDFNLSSLT